MPDESTVHGRCELRTTTDPKIGYIDGNTFHHKQVRYSVIDGEAIFEGDIVLGTAERLEQSVHDLDLEGTIISGSRYRWPGGVVVYTIDSSMPDQQRVTDAISHWESRTNIRFRKRSNEANYVTFRSGGGCSSTVGMAGGQQYVTLGSGCTTGNGIHEIGHTVGLWHEQSRVDRDRYVTIVWSNIQDAMKFNFDQHVTDGTDVGFYDYGSIMHYPANAFAIDSSKPTIIAPQPIGQRDHLSDEDVFTVNAMYPNKTILGDTSDLGPALAVRGNELLLGWVGRGNLRLNFMHSTNGVNFADKVTIGDVSPTALALSTFQGRFVVAWTGVGNHQLNVMQSADGRTWTNKVVLRETSLSAPALAVFNGQLYLSWRGVGNNNLNILRSGDGQSWHDKRILSDTTTSGPTLVTLGSALLLGWRGVGNDHLNVMRSFDGQTFGSKVVLGDTTQAKPNLYVLDNFVYITWQGVGNRFLNVMASNNGMDWAGKVISGETCVDGPVLASVGTKLLWSWSGTDSSHHLNVATI
jgi:hypothetical protein